MKDFWHDKMDKKRTEEGAFPTKQHTVFKGLLVHVRLFYTQLIELNWPHRSMGEISGWSLVHLKMGHR